MSTNIDIKALGFNFEDETLLVESAIRKREIEFQKNKSAEAAFLLCTKLVREHFLRMSSVRKHDFIMKLMNNINRAENVTHILHFLPIGLPKEDNYATAEPDIDILYEKPILDHDRMLDEKTLELTIENHIVWFRTLSDIRQILVITELLRRCGGSVRRMLMKPLVRIYFQRIRESKQVGRSTSSLNKKVHIGTSDCFIESEKEDLNVEEPFDPNHPASIEVEKQKKKMNDIITKYRKEVEAAESKIAQRFQSEDKKGDAAKKTAKAKESKKSSKRGRDKKQEEEIDRIQELPLWIVKKIFGYLDMKTLKKMKSVNSYWAFIIQDLLADMKIRKKLDKTIEKLKSQIDSEKLLMALTAVEPLEEEKKPWRSKRMKANYECGVTLEDLVPKRSRGMVQKSLGMDIGNEIYMEQEDNNNKPLLIFPRQIKEENLYKYTPCILRDVNVVLGLQDGSEKHISYMTYSLSSMLTSSIDFDIEPDEKSLQSW